ncbi:phage tail domain-containing protein [Nosocomiicoccus massiliensis]|uniref:phage tail domain-containing protein n=1 Tax=Nosocomiicoccus massiliensis TaxID=1232430 RepID=UPI0004082A2C|nr:phage tail domain-containing protein [Nosocomiicoccus massiliensis]
MDLEIIKDNKSYLLSDYDIHVQDIRVSSIPLITNRQEIEGFPGSLDYGSYYGDRPITVDFYIKARDDHDYPHLRDLLFELLVDTNPYYIREVRTTGEYEDDSYCNQKKVESYVNGKQYHVAVNNTIDLDQVMKVGFGTIECLTSGLPFAESIYTTKELNDSGYDALVEKYGLVDSINSDNTKYKFTERNFSIWNAGNVTVEPETMYLKITATGTNGKLEIRNKTTGDTFKVNASFGGTLIVDGMNTQLKGANVFRDTNKRYIRLASGKNEFEIIGQFTDITIDFRFYYK